MLSRCPSLPEIERSVDGAPAERGALPIEAHIEDCPSCRACAESIEALDALLAGALLECDPRLCPVPPRLISRLVALGERDAAGDPRSGRPRAPLAMPLRGSNRLARVRSRPSMLPWAAPIAAGVIAAVGGALWLSNRPAETPGGNAAPEPRIALATPEAAGPAGIRPAGVAASPESEEGGPGPVAGVPFADLPAPGAERRSEPGLPIPSAPGSDLARRPGGEVLLPGEVEPPAAPTARPGAGEVAAAPEAPPRPSREISTAGLPGEEPEARGFRLAFVRGDLRVAHPGSAAFVRITTPRFEAIAGDLFRAEGHGAAVAFGRGTELSIRAGSELRLFPERTSEGAVVAFESGELLAEVLAGVAENGLRVRTRAAEVRSAGARLLISAAPDGETRVQVLDGEVEMANAAGEVRLARGEVASATSAASKLAVRKLDERDAQAGAFASAVRVRSQLVFATGFEQAGALFDGALVPGGRLGNGRALAAREARDDPNWGVSAAVRRPKLFRARPGTEIRLAYLLGASSTLLVQAWNESQEASYHLAILRPAIGGWAVASVPVDELRRYTDPGTHPVRDGDFFSSIEVYAGRSGQPVDLKIDDVQVVERH